MFAVVFPYDMGVAGHIVGIINRLCHLACGSIQCHCYAGLCPENFSFLTQDISGQTTLLLLVGGGQALLPGSHLLHGISCGCSHAWHHREAHISLLHCIELFQHLKCSQLPCFCSSPLPPVPSRNKYYVSVHSVSAFLSLRLPPCTWYGPNSHRSPVPSGR